MAGKKSDKPQACGFPVSISSDEVWAVSFGYFVGHTFLSIAVWLVLLSTLGVMNVNECGEDELLQTPHILFAFLISGYYLLSNGLWIWAYWISTTGDMFQPERRRHIKYPLSALLILNGLLFPLFCLGLASIITYDFDTFDLDVEACDQRSKVQFGFLATETIILLFEFIGFIITIFVFLDFKNFRGKNNTNHSVDSDEQFLMLKEFWNRRCRTWCFIGKMMSCGIFGGVKKGERGDFAFAQVGEVFGTWFTGHDSGLSDLITAVLLMRAESLSKKRRDVVKIYKSTSKDFDHDQINKHRLSEELDDFLDTTDTVRKYKLRVGEFYKQALDLDVDDGLTELALAQKTTLVRRRESEDVRREAQEKIKQAGVIPAFEIKRTSTELALTKANWFALNLVNDYKPYMLGLYGWKILVFMDAMRLRPLRNIGKIIGFSNITTPKRLFTNNGHINDGKCCSDSNALRVMTNTAREHLVFASFANAEALIVPYAIMIDHDLKSVILGCRGSMSINDVITDIMIHPSHMKRLGETWGFDGNKRYAHHGMLCCAEEIRIQLQRTQILHKLFRSEPRAEVPEDGEVDIKAELLDKLNVRLEELPDCSDYNLVLVGHSLGAGVSSLLAILLKSEFDKEPSIRVPEADEPLTNRFMAVSYAPPGCVMDEELSKQCEEFMISPVVGRDGVPHLSWLSLQKLRLKALDSLYRSRCNRKTIFATMYRYIPSTQLLYPRHSVPQTPARVKLKQQIEKLAKRVLLLEQREDIDEEELNREFLEKQTMQCPGKLLHLATMFSKKKAWSLFQYEKHYKPFYIEKDDLIDLSMTTRSLFDHFPNYYADVITKVFSEFEEKYREGGDDLDLHVDGETL